MDFGNVLRDLLEERGITQKQLANVLNIAPSTISSYVQNNSEPDFEMLKQISKYFNTSIDFLLDNRIGNIETHEEDEILRIFRNLTEEQKIIFTAQGQVFIQHNLKGDKISGYRYEIELDNKKVKPS
jgi:transcriptional regulator with XRE-family HTH domain